MSMEVQEILITMGMVMSWSDIGAVLGEILAIPSCMAERENPLGLTVFGLCLFRTD